ncbi:hypothetical protein DMP17_38485 [Pseudonocardia sp. TMWB2A]
MSSGQSLFDDDSVDDVGVGIGLARLPRSGCGHGRLGDGVLGRGAGGVDCVDSDGGADSSTAERTASGPAPTGEGAGAAIVCAAYTEPPLVTPTAMTAAPRRERTVVRMVLSPEGEIRRSIGMSTFGRRR